MSVERMITHAILEDHFTGVLNHISHAQDEYSKRTMGLNAAGNVFVAAGTAALGFAAKSVKVAGELDEIKKAMAAVEGQQQATFNMDYIDKFAQHSKFTYLDLAEAGKRLSLQNVSVKDSLGDVADIAAASGKPLAQVAQLYDALLGGRRVGLALSARGGFSQYGISTRDIFEAAGKAYTPGQNLQNAMTPEEVQAAVHKVLSTTGRAGLNEKLARTTLSGVEGMLEDAMTRLENAAGSSNLPKTLGVLSSAADGMNRLADAIKNIPGFGDKLVGAGALLLMTGGVLKGVAAWRTYTAALRTASAVAAIERAGEAAKVPVAAAEGEAVAASTVKYGFLRGMLVKVGSAALGTTAAEVGLTTQMGAGVLAVGLYGVALAGLVAIGYEVAEMFAESNKAARDFEQSIAAVNLAKQQGYDLKGNAGQAQGFSALPVWKQVGEQAINTLSGADIYDTTDSGSSALTDAHSRALAKKHGMAKNGIRAQALKAARDAQEAAAGARRQAAKEAAAKAGNDANNYQLTPALSFKLKQDERKMELLKAEGGHAKEMKDARAQEIADLNTAAGLLEKHAALATDAAKKYALMDQAADDRQKAKLLGLEKGDGDSRDKLDKFAAKIFGGGGLSEDDILKRTGVGRAFLGGGGKAPQSPLAAALQALKKQPAVFVVKIGDREFAQIKTEISNEAAIKVIAEIVKTGESSSRSKLYH